MKATELAKGLDFDAIEAALKVMCAGGIDIRSPRDGDLDDLEQERFNTFSDAIAEYLSLTSGSLDRGVSEEMVEAAKEEAVTFVFDALAKALDLEQWTIHDGSETWDGDVTGTLYGILRDSRAIDPETDVPASRALSASAVKQEPLVTKEWFERKARLEGDHEIGAGGVQRLTTNLTPEKMAVLESLALDALPKWAREEILAARVVKQEPVAFARPEAVKNIAKHDDGITIMAERVEAADAGMSGFTAPLYAHPLPSPIAGGADLAAILDKEEAALVKYRDEDCQGDDVVKRHAWVTAVALLAELRVLRRKFVEAWFLPASPEAAPLPTPASEAAP